MTEKEGAMKIIKKIVLMLAFLAAGFAAGFPAGKSAGFTAGSEWALVQADIIARESGLSMPVSFADGRFRVVIKQPRNIYKRAWQLADRHDDKTEAGNMSKISLNKTVQLAQNIRPIQ